MTSRHRYCNNFLKIVPRVSEEKSEKHNSLCCYLFNKNKLCMLAIPHDLTFCFSLEGKQQQLYSLTDGHIFSWNFYDTKQGEPISLNILEIPKIIAPFHFKNSILLFSHRYFEHCKFACMTGDPPTYNFKNGQFTIVEKRALYCRVLAGPMQQHPLVPAAGYTHAARSMHAASSSWSRSIAGAARDVTKRESFSHPAPPKDR